MSKSWGRFSFFCLALIFNLSQFCFAADNYRGWFEGASGYQKALEKAKSTKQNIFIYVHVDWCPYCKLFEKEVLGSETVQRDLNKIICVLLNPEEGRKEKDLASRFKVRGFPTLLIQTDLNGIPKRIDRDDDAEIFRKSIKKYLRDPHVEEKEIVTVNKISQAQKNKMLLTAVRDGKVPQVKEALRYGASPESMTHLGDTVLIEAAACGYDEIVKLLLDYGADVRAKNANGETAEEVARMNGRMQIAKILQESRK